MTSKELNEILNKTRRTPNISLTPEQVEELINDLEILEQIDNAKKYVEEVLIVGIPKSKMNEFCIEHNLVVEVSSKTGRVLRWYERKS